VVKVVVKVVRLSVAADSELWLVWRDWVREYAASSSFCGRVQSSDGGIEWEKSRKMQKG